MTTVKTEIENAFKERVFDIRKDVETIKVCVLSLREHSVFTNAAATIQDVKRYNEMFVGDKRFCEMKANLTLAYRHLEGARMRMGKVLQALDGGESVYQR